MNTGTNITMTLVETLDTDTQQELSRLLMAVVDDGASIGFLPPLQETEAREYWQNVIQPGVLLWIARENNTIVGTIQLHFVSKPNGRHRVEIAKLMVHPQHRRKGIAGALMATVEAAAQAEKKELLVLDTREGDPSNILYLSLGYVEAGRIPYFARSGSGSLDTTVLYYKKLEY
ncbi:GNAT family N-acetyltransferase [Paenibacillus sp. sgz500958]|uniref:GNAT family N-acetyltransferase n=1 Tax=Paenibacillus sp. sgz500958 TaxID=3242475 RepID=UPI0036D2B6ED